MFYQSLLSSMPGTQLTLGRLMLSIEIRMSISGSNWNPFMSPFKATLISRFALSMLPSRPFRSSQRHQTHLHFLAGVITKDKTVLKGSKFTGVFAFGKEDFQSLWNSAPWFQPGVKFTLEESIIAYSISLHHIFLLSLPTSSSVHQGPRLDMGEKLCT